MVNIKKLRWVVRKKWHQKIEVYTLSFLNMAKECTIHEQQRKVYFIGDNVLRHEGLN